MTGHTLSPTACAPIACARQDAARGGDGFDGGQGHSPMAAPIQIFDLLARTAAAGRPCVLATIVGLTGSAARAVGTHMAILADGTSAGSFSSGCVEAAIVAEALDVARTGAARTVRFGQGSPYVDIRLPCGGGMDVLFIADPDATVMDAAADRLRHRRPVSLELRRAGGVALGREAGAGAETVQRGWAGGRFVVSHIPPLRLVVIGHGAETLAAAGLARRFGAAVEIHTPDAQIALAARLEGFDASRLRTPQDDMSLPGDPWTAFLFLFHDHDWEPALLRAALATPAFWIGAMGSIRTHAARCQALRAYGVAEADIARVHGPIGLIARTRDPSTLALSALAQIVGAYHDAG